MAFSLVQFNRFLISGAVVALLVISVVSVTLFRGAALTTPLSPALTCDSSKISVTPPTDISTATNITFQLNDIGSTLGEIPQETKLRWYFDDGQYRDGNPASYRYSSVGTYYPLVTVSAPGFQSTTCSTAVIVR